MREIKFRAWDGDNMYYWDSTNHPYTEEIDGTPYKKLFYLPMSFLVGDSNDMEWMQYTGLKDCNRKEIYEGDILKLTVGTKVFHPRVIEWDTDTMGFSLKKYGNGNEYGKSKRGSIHNGVMKEHEIIGNIYENSDLIQIV